MDGEGVNAAQDADADAEEDVVVDVVEVVLLGMLLLLLLLPLHEFRQQLLGGPSRSSERPAYVGREVELVLVPALVVLLVLVLEDEIGVEDELDEVEEELDEVDGAEVVEGIEEDVFVLVDDAELSYIPP